MRLNSGLIQRAPQRSPHSSENEPRLSTGVESLDTLLGGGLHRGSLVEVWGRSSSGRTSLLFSVLAQATRQEEVVAYIDTFHTLDPQFAGRAGLDLSRLLWIQCRASLDNALKAADIVAHAGGFGVIALDLERDRNAESIKRTSYSVWYRLRRIVEGTATVVLILCREPIVGSAAQTSISLQRMQRHWEFSGAAPEENRARYLRGLSSEAQLHRGKAQGHVTLRCLL